MAKPHENHSADDSSRGNGLKGKFSSINSEIFPFCFDIGRGPCSYFLFSMFKLISFPVLKELNGFHGSHRSALKLIDFCPYMINATALRLDLSFVKYSK